MKIAVDIDDTLTEGDARWWEDGAIDATPNEDALEEVQRLYAEGHTIMLWTARPNYANGMDICARTEMWLAENDVPYHTLTMDKLSADVYIDDKAMSADDEQYKELSSTINIGSFRQ